MDWNLVVRTQDDAHPNGHRMETDAREYLEAKKATALQRTVDHRVYIVFGRSPLEDTFSKRKKKSGPFCSSSKAREDSGATDGLSTTLKGVAQKCFDKLSSNSIKNFTEVSYLITGYFLAN